MFYQLYANEMADVDYQAIYNFISKYLNKKSLILDAGMGPGYLLKILIDNNYNAYGIDNDEGMLSYATNELNLYGRVFYHDLLEPIDTMFDVVLCIFDVINYFIEPKIVFKNIFNSLNKDGLFIFDIYKEEVLIKMAGFKEVHNDFSWETKVFKKKLKHLIKTSQESYEIIQYAYDLNYYIKQLEELGFDVLVNKGPDIRKHYIIAKKTI